MQIPATLWTILVQNKTFEGIRPTPNPKPNPDGSYTVILTVTQWKVFQENQKKAPITVVLTSELTKKPDDKISVSNDPSAFLKLTSKHVLGKNEH